MTAFTVQMCPATAIGAFLFPKFLDDNRVASETITMAVFEFSAGVARWTVGMAVKVAMLAAPVTVSAPFAFPTATNIAASFRARVVVHYGDGNCALGQQRQVCGIGNVNFQHRQAWGNDWRFRRMGVHYLNQHLRRVACHTDNIGPDVAVGQMSLNVNAVQNTLAQQVQFVGAAISHRPSTRPFNRQWATRDHRVRNALIQKQFGRTMQPTFTARMTRQVCQVMLLDSALVRSERGLAARAMQAAVVAARHIVNVGQPTRAIHTVWD